MLALLTLVACGGPQPGAEQCLEGHEDASERAEIAVPGRGAPWEEVSFRFLGASFPEGRGQGPVEVTWRISHSDARAFLSFGAFLFIPTRSYPPDRVEFEVQRTSPTTIEVRARAAVGDSAMRGAYYWTEMGLVVTERAESDPWWIVPPRPFPLLGTDALYIEYDGTLELQLADAPAARMGLSGGWVLDDGVPYAVRYRIYNRTAERREVHIFVRGRALTVEGPSERDVVIPASGSVDLPAVLQVTREEPCRHDCASVYVRFSDEERWIDAISSDVEVR